MEMETTLKALLRLPLRQFGREKLVGAVPSTVQSGFIWQIRRNVLTTFGPLLKQYASSLLPQVVKLVPVTTTTIAASFPLVKWKTKIG